MPNPMKLEGFSLVVSPIIAFSLGVVSAVKRGPPNTFIVLLTLLIESLVDKFPIKEISELESRGFALAMRVQHLRRFLLH